VFSGNFSNISATGISWHSFGMKWVLLHISQKWTFDHQLISKPMFYDNGIFFEIYYDYLL
jgi:hypothetical protein